MTLNIDACSKTHCSPLPSNDAHDLMLGAANMRPYVKCRVGGGSGTEQSEGNRESTLDYPGRPSVITRSLKVPECG